MEEKKKISFKEELENQWKKVKEQIEDERSALSKTKTVEDMKYEILGKAISYLPDKEEVYEKVIDVIYPYYAKLNKNMIKEIFKHDLEMFAIRKMLSNLDISLYLLTIGKSVNGRKWEKY